MKNKYLSVAAVVPVGQCRFDQCNNSVLFIRVALCVCVAGFQAGALNFDL